MVFTANDFAPNNTAGLGRGLNLEGFTNLERIIPRHEASFLNNPNFEVITPVAFRQLETDFQKAMEAAEGLEGNKLMQSVTAQVKTFRKVLVSSQPGLVETYYVRSKPKVQQLADSLEKGGISSWELDRLGENVKITKNGDEIADRLSYFLQQAEEACTKLKEELDVLLVKIGFVPEEDAECDGMKRYPYECCWGEKSLPCDITSEAGVWNVNDKITPDCKELCRAYNDKVYLCCEKMRLMKKLRMYLEAVEHNPDKIYQLDANLAAILF